MTREVSAELSLEGHPTHMAKGTVCVVDMVGYSSVANVLEEHTSAQSVAELNRQIQGFMTAALQVLSDKESVSVISRPGDGIILLFGNAEDAHIFGAEVHRGSARHNRLRAERSTQRWFRVGISTGNVTITRSDDANNYAGMAIAMAARLEASAHEGQIVADSASYQGFPQQIRDLYGVEEEVRGKREERFRAHRYQAVHPGLASSIPDKPRYTRRALIGGGLASIFGVTGWYALPYIQNWNSPLPARRFIALLPWPEPAPDTVPLLQEILRAIHLRLSNVEATVRDLLVIGPDEIARDTPKEQVPESKPLSVSDIASVWNANLVLGAQILTEKSHQVLHLRVFDIVSNVVLRKSKLTLDRSDSVSFNRLVGTTAARLLDLPKTELFLSDDEELTTAPPEAQRLFAQGKLLGDDPNGKNVDEAIELYQKALQLDDKFALAYAELGDLYIRRYIKTNDGVSLPLADINLKAALSRNPNSERTQLISARWALVSGQPDAALRMLSPLLKSALFNSDALLYKAEALGQLNRSAEQEIVYRELTRLRPNYWKAWNDLGGQLRNRAVYKEAVSCYETATAIAPKVVIPWVNLGQVFLEQNRRTDAINALNRSLAIVPNKLALATLGDMSFQDKDYQAALKYFVQAEKLAPSDHYAVTDVADCYEMLGQHQKVIAEYSRAAQILAANLATNPNDGLGWMTLGVYTAKIGRKQEAEADILLAERHGASNTQAIFTKARILALLGNTAQAKKLIFLCLDQGFSRADIELVPDLSSVWTDPEYKRYASNKHNAA